MATSLSVKSEEAHQNEEAGTEAAAAGKWPGWPGNNVFRVIVAVAKVGSIIGRKGELIKKMCDDTRARIRVLEGPLGTSDRVILISGKEEPNAPLSPAMDAVLRVFKRVNGLFHGGGETAVSDAASAAFVSIRLLVASSQAINLIGKQGSIIKSIQESTGAFVRVLPEDELPSYVALDERIVEIYGEAMKVLKALEAVIGQLRKFLVDHSVIPIFEKTHNATISQERPTEFYQTQPLTHTAPASQTGKGSDYSLLLKRDPLIYDRETHLDSNIPQSALSLYGQDLGFGGLRSTGVGCATATAPLVTQMTQTMQVPLLYAEDIIGVGGSNIAYIRRTSGAVLTIQESRGLGDEITVEIKGTSSQVQMAQQLIEEFIGNHKEPAPSTYAKIGTGLSSYSKLADSSYASSSFGSHLGGYGSSSLGGYGSPGVRGGYSSFRF